MRRGAITFDYGNNLRGRRRTRGTRTRSRSLASSRRTCGPVLRGEGAVPVGGAVGGPGGHRAHRRAGAGAVPGGPAPAALDRPGAGEDRVPGAAGADLLAGAGGAGPVRGRAERPGGERRDQRAGRDRPGPPGHGLGGESVPRDGGHEGRQRRGGRLADPERAAEHGERGQLGQLPPRRRRGDRQLAARRAGHRGGWHARDAGAAGTGPDERPWPGRGRHADAGYDAVDTARREGIMLD
jgi:hypothetical protein